MDNVTAKELLANAIMRMGTLKAVCDLTKIRKSTLLRIKAGKTSRPHSKTLGKLLQASNDR